MKHSNYPMVLLQLSSILVLITQMGWVTNVVRMLACILAMVTASMVSQPLFW